MPKTFPVGIEVEEIALGRVLRLLHMTEGVARIDLNFDDAPKSVPQIDAESDSHGTAPKQPVQGSAKRLQDLKLSQSQMVITSYLAQHGPTKKSILERFLEQNNFSASSLASLITILRSKRIIHRHAMGVWKLNPAISTEGYTPMGLLPRVKAAFKGVKISNRGFDITSRSYVLVFELLLIKGAASRRDVGTFFLENGMSDKTCGNVLAKLRWGDYLTYTDGVIMLTPKGLEVANDLPTRFYKAATDVPAPDQPKKNIFVGSEGEFQILEEPKSTPSSMEKTYEKFVADDTSHSEALIYSAAQASLGSSDDESN